MSAPTINFLASNGYVKTTTFQTYIGSSLDVSFSMTFQTSTSSTTFNIDITGGDIRVYGDSTIPSAFTVGCSTAIFADGTHSIDAVVGAYTTLDNVELIGDASFNNVVEVISDSVITPLNLLTISTLITNVQVLIKSKIIDMDTYGQLYIVDDLQANSGYQFNIAVTNSDGFNRTCS